MRALNYLVVVEMERLTKIYEAEMNFDFSLKVWFTHCPTFEP